MRDIKELTELLRNCELPSELEIKFICDKAIEIFITEPNVINLNPPITVCGDIHGQFYDLLELFLVGDDPPESNYCFLGDYVDRGRYSLQTFLFLLTLKIQYPSNITLLRGNHESRKTRGYGFYDECIKQFTVPSVYKYCTNVFDVLPICAVINQEMFAVHGGLSPEFNEIDKINALDRRGEIPESGVISDLLWSDPDDDIKEFGTSSRGAGYIFGYEAVNKFTTINALTLILRAHQLCADGYQYWFNNQLLTVWSAPNYCYRCGNKASILEIDEYMNNKLKFFNEAPPDINRVPDDETMKPLYFL